MNRTVDCLTPGMTSASPSRGGGEERQAVVVAKLEELPPLPPRKSDGNADQGLEEGYRGRQSPCSRRVGAGLRGVVSHKELPRPRPRRWLFVYRPRGPQADAAWRGRGPWLSPLRRRADRTCPPPELGASTFAVQGVPPSTPPLWTEVGRPSSPRPRHPLTVPSAPLVYTSDAALFRARSEVRPSYAPRSASGRAAVSGPRRGRRGPPSSSLLSRAAGAAGGSSTTGLVRSRRP